METLLGIPPMQLVVEKKANQTACKLLYSNRNHFKKSDCGQYAFFKMATEDLLVLLALSDSMLPLEVFDQKYLVKDLFREI
jgi:hypothetical protein